MTAFDRDLDYRHDVVYFGRVINDGTLPWRGKIYRLTMGAGGADREVWHGDQPYAVGNFLRKHSCSHRDVRRVPFWGGDGTGRDGTIRDGR